MAKSTTKGVSPVWKKALKGVSAAVFENTSAEGKTFFKTSIQRTYKEGDEFKTTNSYSRDDLPVVEMLAEEAFAFILETESKRNKDSE